MKASKDTIAATVDGVRSDFAAARASRFQRRRSGISSSGSGADYHYRREGDWLKLIEYARDMDRNDPVIGSVVDRATLNIIQGGFILDVNTGDTGLDDAIEERWKDWATDPEQCDISGEYQFSDFEWFATRSQFVDGDAIYVGTDSGHLQPFESHRCRNPFQSSDSIVHGVELDQYRKRLAYHISAEDIDPNRVMLKGKEFRRIPARDSNGVRRVFQPMSAKRTSQTRGITAFAPVFDMIGIHDDIEFAAALKQQLSSCLVFIEEMESGGKLGGHQQLGGQTTYTRADGSTQLDEGISPAIRVKTPPGGKITGFNHNTPGDQFFGHVKLLLTFLGINLGMPLVMVLMDAKETNFSGWRGAVDQARMGFRFIQGRQKKRFTTPVFQWKLSQFTAEDPAMKAGLSRFMRAGTYCPPHAWNAPQWPYIEPWTDRQADSLDIANCMVPAREVDARNGRNHWSKVEKIIEERVDAIRKAKTAAKLLNAEFPEDKNPVRWDQIFTFPSPDGVRTSFSGSADRQQQPQDQGAGNGI